MNAKDNLADYLGWYPFYQASTHASIFISGLTSTRHLLLSASLTAYP